MEESNRLLKILAYALGGVFVLVLVFTCDRTTGREVFNTLRSLVATIFILLVTLRFRMGTSEIIRKNFEEYEKTGKNKKEGICNIAKFNSVIYKPYFWGCALAYIVSSTAAAIWIGIATDRYFVRMFLMMFSAFLLIGTQGERQYVIKNLKRFFKQNKISNIWLM